ncbi:uncharacterized protein EURHEDRAFT_386285 [Aspergillus ruber CBS 135680]|uniref:Uncharacterized protein n=1 Tax=Aspergillus ruber (strain CBS 135680) TaxID=1388766 RepID=A0A017SF59_ASPRC|nr:uncharacterized protein EURHEDRAFT_386285 [Aspergillus ruber CBS 135680]EYE95406.1 hypothetical protein EURHEDRAFT_386285 [Aspergillus ruber CBS 135680]
MAALQQEAEALHRKLNEDGETSNQYLMVKRLPKGVSVLLGEYRKMMDSVIYRLSWEGERGQIRIIPSPAYTMTTRRLADKITDALLDRGVRFRDFGWGSTKAYPSLIGRGGKQPDDCFLPPTRRELPAEEVKWPTLVIVSGTSESQVKVIEDASWWFENSYGQVRMVITLLINKIKKTIDWEMRQLTERGRSPPEKSYFTRPYLEMPPLALQHPAEQQQYISQMGQFSQDRIIKNTRMYIHSRALLDRRPGPREKDIQLNAQDLIDIAKFL